MDRLLFDPNINSLFYWNRRKADELELEQNGKGGGDEGTGERHPADDVHPSLNAETALGHGRTTTVVLMKSGRLRALNMLVCGKVTTPLAEILLGPIARLTIGTW